MKQSEKASIFRIVTDLIKADSIIDTREIEKLDSIRERFAIKKEDEMLGFSYTFANAIRVLLESPKSLQCELAAIFNELAMSDNFCAREEALLLLTLRLCMSLDIKLDCKAVSIETSSVNIDPTQILYVESDFDNDVNWEINEKFREIVAEVRLAGFDLVYLPKIAEHYRAISNTDFLKIAGFLYPNVSYERLKTVVQHMHNLSTSEFCKDQLAGKLGVREFSVVNPSLMIKIGDSFVGDKNIANFLLVELDKDVISSIRYILDLFSEYYHTSRLNYLREEKGRYIFTGFYKQIFDIYMVRKGIKSPVVIDVYRGHIRFSEADLKIEKLHLREKALYALFMLESASGGVNFSKPSTPNELARYTRRMTAVQEKYRLIYKKFGGEPQKAPDISKSEIRLPMIALIRKQLKALGDVLFHVDDYMIQRNIFGNYCINISPSLCCYCGVNANDIYRLSDSEEWQRISAL